MPPIQRFEPDDPREWLNRARSNLLRAQSGRTIEGIYLEDVCFDAQQAAEKAIKAVLLGRGIEFPKTHNIGTLLALLPDDALPVPEDVAQAKRLTGYAVKTRYPTSGEPVSDEDCDAAIRCADAAVRWAAEIIARGAGSSNEAEP